MLKHSGPNAQTGVFVREGLGHSHMVREKPHEDRDKDAATSPGTQESHKLEEAGRTLPGASE